MQIWATNSAGWDFKGADLQCVVCRTTALSSDEPEAGVMITMVTRADIERNDHGAFIIVRQLSTAGHTACSGPHIKYENLRVPAKRDDRRGAVPLLARQAVANLLIKIKMQTEACRCLTWKAANCMENGPGDYSARRELALAAKVYCSDAAVKACIGAINAARVYVHMISISASAL